MKKIFFLGIIGFALYGLSSCDKLDSLDDYKKQDPGATATVNLGGEYYVTLDVYDAASSAWVVDIGGGYTKIMVYNTASNISDSVWIDDLEFWPIKIRTKVNAVDRLFNKSENEVSKYVYTKNLTSATAGDTINLRVLYPINNRVVPLGGNKFAFSGQELITLNSGSVILGIKTAAGNPTDSIVVEFEGSSDAGTQYRYAGYKRTGFLEDEH